MIIKINNHMSRKIIFAHLKIVGNHFLSYKGDAPPLSNIQNSI